MHQIERTLTCGLLYCIVGFFEIRKFREFRGWDRFVKYKSSKNMLEC